MLPVTDLLKHISNQDELEIKNGHKIRFMQNQAPVVVWNITNHCNMACPHCYSSAKLKKDPAELSNVQLEIILNKLNEFGIRIIIFSGGEPLMRSELIELVKQATKMGISCHLSSNGVLLDQTMTTRLKDAGIRYVGISLDGMSGFNDPYRHYKNAFEDASRGLINARNAGLKTGIRMTLSSQNQDQLFPLIEYARGLQVSRFYISHLVYSGRGLGFSTKDQIGADKQASMEQIFEYAVRNLGNSDVPAIVTGGNDADGVALYLFVKRIWGEKKSRALYELLLKRGGNSAGEKMINIDHLGNVHPDQFWRSVSPGNLLNTPLEEIFQEGIMPELPKRVHFLKGKCKACQYIDICRGSHRERAEVAFNDIWAEDPACYLSAAQVQSPGISNKSIKLGKMI